MKFFDRFLNKFDKEQRTTVIWVSVITVVFLVYVIFNREIGLINWAKNGIELSLQKKEIVKYHKEINAMDKKIKMLSTDKDTLEQFARENFLFAAPGEDVYLIPEKD